MDIERKCINCCYYPCLRINCGKVCDNHKFGHEKMIEEFEYYDWEGMR